MDLQKEWPGLSAFIVGVPNDGSGTALQKFIDLNKTQKKKLNEALHLPEGEHEEKLSLAPLARLKNSTGLLKGLAHILLKYELTDEEILNNHLTDGPKLSKKICNAVFTADTLQKIANVECEPYGDELPKLSTSRKSIEFIPLFIQNYFSELATYTSGVTGFSTKFLTMMAAATSQNYTSCYSLTGCNSRGSVVYATMPNSGVVYFKKDGQITGRAWIVFNQDCTMFVVFRPYGFLSGDSIERVCTWICASLGGEWASTTDVYDLESNLDYSSLVFVNAAGVYKDPVQIAYTKKTVHGAQAIFFTERTAPNTCLICGNSILTGRSTAVCDKCFNRTCKKCGKMFFSTDPNQKFCDTCKGVKGKCIECGEALVDGVCPKCGWAERCFLCGTPGEDFVNVDGYNVCKDCVAKLMSTTCDRCKKDEELYVYGEFKVCSSCYLLLYRNSIPRTREALRQWCETCKSKGQQGCDRCPAKPLVDLINSETTESKES